jgi:hypothetical protein
MKVTVTANGVRMTKMRTNAEGSLFGRADGRVVGPYEYANGETQYIRSKTMSKTEITPATSTLSSSTAYVLSA